MSLKQVSEPVDFQTDFVVGQTLAWTRPPSRFFPRSSQMLSDYKYSPTGPSLLVPPTFSRYLHFDSFPFLNNKYSFKDHPDDLSPDNEKLIYDRRH